jgi:hypothetical protein
VRLPGRAWLEFEVAEQENGSAVRRRVFAGMLRGIPARVVREAGS